MIIELKTKRRWIVSVVNAVAEGADRRITVSSSDRRTSGRNRLNQGEKSFTTRLKAATRPLAEAAG